MNLLPARSEHDTDRAHLCWQLYRSMGLVTLAVVLYALVPQWHWQMMLLYGRSAVMAMDTVWRIMQYDDRERDRRWHASLSNVRTNAGGFALHDAEWGTRSLGRQSCEDAVGR